MYGKMLYGVYRTARKQRIPNDLASVLGVFKYSGDISQTTNRDNLVSGFYRTNTDAPSWWFNNETTNGIVLMFVTSSSFKSIVYIEHPTGNIYITNYNWTYWTAWKKITATAV